MILLACDLDSTLVGNPDALAKLFEKIEPLQLANKLKLVYATGRSLERFMASRMQERLLDSDAVIAAVGTEIYMGDMYQPLASWQETFNTNWDRIGIHKLCLRLTTLKDQPQSEQRPFKLSFIGTGKAGQAKELDNLAKELEQKFPNAQLLVSHGGEYIDVVPKGISKGLALQFLANVWDIKDAKLIAAGDSLNDVPMLQVARAIVVSNAYPEVAAWYQAHPGPEVYFAKQPFAAGVAEGLEHYLGKNWGEL